ncbi:hypothetical protein PVAND_000210 [Polypedilum vanderplanki]|uniref:Peptidase S1 domain-containing protein n=1 Tax=Polypedilum vanderplanki TaxID=319348 RepID=A0A9J6BJN2_POLVA|nr:hypothetical protein PVAND_000210 [Polypedilum vanderplanki]
MLVKVFFFALIAVIVQAKIPQKNFDIAPNIVNGSSTTIQEFPFMASLQWEFNSTTWLHYCGGTIINEFWVLTAAHCLYGDVTEGNQVEYGMTVISHESRGENIALYEQIIWHEKYDPYTLINDIGLIKTKTAMSVGLFEYKVKLALPSDYFMTGTPAIVAGWGRVATGLPISVTLQKAAYQIFSSRDCAELHEPGSVFYNNICGGQIGGPLLVDGVQVGIVSWSIKPCTVPPYPGVFTSIGPYINWIMDNTMLNMKMRMFLQVRD